MRALLRWLLRLLYGFTAHNEEVLRASGPVLLLPNHVSWWDWLLIGVCLEEDWRFVTSSASAELSWLHKKIMVNRRTFAVDMNSPYAVRHMAEYLQKGGRLVLFPEGRISMTGSLMKLFDGTGFLIAKTHPKIVTAYIRGAQRLPFSRNPSLKKLFPPVSMHFSGLLAAPSIAGHTVSEVRLKLTDWLRDQMVRQQFETEMEFGPASLPQAISGMAQLMPGKVVLEDLSQKGLSYRALLTNADALASYWKTRLGEESRTGILLPNTNALPVTILSVWAASKTPAILNYTTGSAIMQSCCRVAGVKQAITSRLFLEKAKLDLTALEKAGVQFIYLEDARKELRAAQKLGAALRNLIHPGLREAKSEGNSTAAVLFTSGSEGEPKAVELTHRNLLANIRQMCSVIDLTEADRFFNAMPLFHSFGFTIGLLLPLTRGVFTFIYLSPLHYRVVPAAFYNLNCTVLFGTNTFLNGYARKANSYDFRSLRYLFAGAEKLQESTASLWMNKFGVRILEGYGATECSPCVSVNAPMRIKPGSAGQFLPGIEHRLEQVEGVNPDSGSAGRLFVRGPNIMRGYLNDEANAKFRALNGWYDTGDIVKVDQHGYLFILGRLKRFAKVSGEMVSLAAVEDAIAAGITHYGIKFAVAVIARPDEGKGEKLVAITNEPRLTLEEARSAIRARGLGNLAAPREIRHVHDLPRLGTGKLNHREIEKLF